MASDQEVNIKCFVCENERNCFSFLCPSCISKGDFTSSKCSQTSYGGSLLSNSRLLTISSTQHTAGSSRLKEKFYEKKQRLWDLEEQHRDINQKLEQLLEENRQLEAIEQLISNYEFKIASLQKLIKELKVELAKSESLSKKLASREQDLRRSRENREKSIIHTRNQISQVQLRIKQAEQERERLLKEIKIFTKESISQLKRYIFPFNASSSPPLSSEQIIGYHIDAGDAIDGSGPLAGCSNTGLRSDYQASDDHAFLTTSTSCEPPSMDSWSNIHFSNTRYNIVESWIPRDSVSRAYCEWSLQQREHSKMSPAASINEVKTRDNVAYRVSAALAFITQMLTVVSYYMDVRFPKRLSFVEFFTKYSDSGSELLLSEEELLHKVAKLDANLVYLCLSQRVQPSLIEPAIPGKNLDLLLNPNFSDLGTFGQPLYIDSETHQRVEEALQADYRLYPESENQEYILNEPYDEDFIENDWEPVHSSTPYVELVSSQQAASITGGFVSSFAATALNSITSFIRKK